jgi:hypothetical protein
MAQHVQTRTIHTIFIDLQDDVLAKIEQGDEVEVVLQTRSGSTHSKINERALDRLLDRTELDRISPKVRVSKF